jgi:spermidine/putrescine transport system permease protein
MSADVAAPTTPVAERRRRSTWRVTSGLLSTPMIWLGAFFVVPILMVALYSIGGISGIALLDQPSWTLQPWKAFFTSNIYLGLFWKAMRISLTVSVLSVALAYPVAYFMALVAGRRKYTVLLIILTPFFTSYLLRVLAWRVILNPQGVVQSFLRNVGLLGEDDLIEWMFNSQFAVHLVLAYVWVPFVALPIFVSLEGLNLNLLEASSDLGASRWRTFWSVTLPLSMPGVIASFVFVFIPTIGEYITPLLVGGESGFMFGNAIQSAFGASFDWQRGAAMSMFLIGVVAVLLAIFGRYLNVRTVTE